MSLFDTGVIPIINNWLLEESKKERDYGDYWSASSAGYCLRRVIFERLKVPYVTEDARKQRLFSSGHVFHEWIQGITKESGVSIAQELELQDEELMIRGHIDDLVLVKKYSVEYKPELPEAPKELKGLVLYDYKTANSKWFEYAKTRPMSHYHRHQIGTYMYMLRKPRKKEGLNKDIVWLGNRATSEDLTQLTEARRLAISKDDLRLYEQQLLWSDELEKEIVGYWTELNKYWKNKKIPPCTCADYEKNTKTGIGFMASEKYNPYHYNGVPCSIEYYHRWKSEQKEINRNEKPKA